MPVRNELLGIFFINVHALALNVRRDVSAVMRSFVGNNLRGGKRLFYKLDGVGNVAGAVGILNPQNEIAALRLRKQIGVKCRAQVANVHVTRRARRKSRSNSLQNISSKIFKT